MEEVKNELVQNTVSLFEKIKAIVQTQSEHEMVDAKCEEITNMITTLTEVHEGE